MRGKFHGLKLLHWRPSTNDKTLRFNTMLKVMEIKMVYKVLFCKRIRKINRHEYYAPLCEPDK